MPQLDPITYFTQYVYLLITFIGVYFFVLSFIIPKTLCALKVRQKLNSLDNHTEKSIGKATPAYAVDSDSTAFLEYKNLLNNNWIVETSKAGTVEMGSRWLVSARALKLAQVVRLRKLLLEHTVQKISGSF